MKFVSVFQWLESVRLWPLGLGYYFVLNLPFMSISSYSFVPILHIFYLFSSIKLNKIWLFDCPLSVLGLSFFSLKSHRNSDNATCDYISSLDRGHGGRGLYQGKSTFTNHPQRDGQEKKEETCFRMTILHQINQTSFWLKSLDRKSHKIN